MNHGDKTVKVNLESTADDDRKMQSVNIDRATVKEEVFTHNVDTKNMRTYVLKADNNTVYKNKVQ